MGLGQVCVDFWAAWELLFFLRSFCLFILWSCLCMLCVVYRMLHAGAIEGSNFKAWWHDEDGGPVLYAMPINHQSLILDHHPSIPPFLSSFLRSSSTISIHAHFFTPDSVFKLLILTMKWYEIIDRGKGWGERGKQKEEEEEKQAEVKTAGFIIVFSVEHSCRWTNKKYDGVLLYGIGIVIGIGIGIGMF